MSSLGDSDSEPSSPVTRPNPASNRTSLGDEDEFEYDAPVKQSTAGKPTASHLSLPRKVLDQHYDEAVEVSASSAESSLSPAVSPGASTTVGKVHATGGSVSAMNVDDSEDDEPLKADPTGLAATPDHKRPVSNTPQHQQHHPSMKSIAPMLTQSPPLQRVTSDDEEDEEDDDDATTDAAAAARLSQAKLYNAADFAHVSASPEITELFVLIGRHKPQDIELDTKFLPFIPDYIPAIGEIDPFVKVTAPTSIGNVSELGLKVVDEPACSQSDPSVLEMSLRVLSKGVSHRSRAINARIENAEKNPKKLSKWIESIEELHRVKPQPKMSYTNSMPDIDTLMRVWPPQLESLLSSLVIGATNPSDPLIGVDLSTVEMSQLCCAMLDIPVYGNEKIIESLHLLFTLYHEFTQNAHFQMS